MFPLEYWIYDTNNDNFLKEDNDLKEDESDNADVNVEIQEAKEPKIQKNIQIPIQSK